MDRRLNRRLFLGRMSLGATAVAVLGIAACGGDEATPDALTPRLTTTPPEGGGADTTSTGAASTSAQPSTTAPGADIAVATLERVSLGFVSAYVVERNGEAAVVDTGVSGSAGQIEAGLAALGLGWDNVGHVILTHLHGDHIGSITEVMNAAPAATGYAGAADIPSINAPRELTAVGDGDSVMDLSIIETPGHTPGHISVLDATSRFLIAGDAMNGGDAVGGEAGTVAGANPQFTPDLAMADDSIRKLALLPFDSIYFGHGEPVIGGADALVREFAASI